MPSAPRLGTRLHRLAVGSNPWYGLDPSELKDPAHRCLYRDQWPAAKLPTSMLYAIRGTFEDASATETVYTCERAGLNEICADVSDGACVKTLCTDVRCPDDLGGP